MISLRQIALRLMVLAALPAFGADSAVLKNGYSIRHEHRAVMGAVTRLYLSGDPTSYVDVPTAEIEHFEKDLTPAAAPIKSVAVPAVVTPNNLDDIIDAVSGRHHLDPDLVNSVIHAESRFNVRAVSPKGAQGLMQLMPQTASQLGVTNAFDPQANVEGGTRYLRELLERYNFDLVKALAAYNAGPRRVEQYRGVPPYYETRVYVANIIRDFNRKKKEERRAIALKAKKPAPSAAKPTASRTASLHQQAGQQTRLASSR